ncbi:Mitogen-activated protein kinase kinase 5 [Phytophthora pseudosyringae]|uniref:Mitogen-activated protein kinase kinase 5 n=1 Tax=Phytophthora pseudosyringae TaxID=221518 RepID=A0A8T1WI84_9STRA|nr:Mitogen-activated protein kinase kinase 5 [Phytophthora pseudosyringae]
MENSMAKSTTFVGALTYMSLERIAREVNAISRLHRILVQCGLVLLGFSRIHREECMIRNEPPPRPPEGEFSGLFCDFVDKCPNKDKTER